MHHKSRPTEEKIDSLRLPKEMRDMGVATNCATFFYHQYLYTVTLRCRAYTFLTV